MRYSITPADRRPMPASYRAEERYLGLRASPYAAYFRETRPVQPHVVEALLGGMAPTEYAYDFSEAASIMSRPGHHRMETGWTRVRGGYFVAVLTDMPNVTADMWDWWFGWHLRSTDRYKLWYPDAHQFTAVGDDRSADRTLTDRQRYLDNVSYVDEYVGGVLHRLAIRFVSPSRLGFAESPGATLICARVGLSDYPIAQGWLVHQVRPTSGGCEMRSRFFLNDTELLDLPSHSLTGVGAGLLTTPLARFVGRHVPSFVPPRVLGPTFGHDLAYHCAAEMNHLASFLPALHAEFRGTP